jgi:Tol biopolymer transport system component
MKWPTHTDYQDAIQAPQICFAEPGLKSGEVACDMLGLPKVMSGNFASVYELRTSGGRWAIRCFVRQVPGQQGRYARLSEHLSKVVLPYLVRFEFIQKGILILGDWYPVVKMQWVEGVPLNVYVEEHYRDATLLAGLAVRWRALVNALQQHQIAHGDFQHGNVMVNAEGEFRLVDYDGMFVPAFGRGRSPELGHANFQHPRRTPDYYEERLDNFSALVIYLSFLALAREPELWEKFYAGDNLILGSADYRNPRGSAAFQRLKESPDDQVRQLASLVEQCCLMPIAQVPRFEETLKQLEQGTLKHYLESLPPPAPTTAETWWDGNAPDEGRPGAEAQGGATTVGPGLSRPSPTAGPAPSLTRPSPPLMSRPSPQAGAQGTRPSTPLPSRTTASYTGTRASPPSPAAVPTVPGASTATVHLPGDRDSSMAFCVAGLALSLAAFVPALRPWCGTAGAICGGWAFLKARPGAAFPRFGGLAASLLGAALAIMGFLGLASSKAKAPVAPSDPTEQDLAVSRLQAPPTGATQALVVAPPAPAPKPAESGPKITLLGSLSGHTKGVEALSASTDGRWLASSASDNSVKIWDVQAGRLRKGIDGLSEAPGAVTFLPDGRTVAAVCADNTVGYWDAETGVLQRRVTAFTNNLWTPVLAPDGRTLAAGGVDRKVVRVVDVVTGESRRQLPALASWVKSAAFSPDGRLLAVGAFDDTVHLWDLVTGNSKWSATAKGNTTESVAFSGDGSRLALAADGRLARVLDGMTGQPLQTFTGHAGEIRACALSRDGRWLATGSADKTVRVWQVSDGKLVQTLAGHADGVTAVAISADGRLLFSGGADRTVKLWSITP